MRVAGRLECIGLTCQARARSGVEDEAAPVGVEHRPLALQLHLRLLPAADVHLQIELRAAGRIGEKALTASGQDLLAGAEALPQVMQQIDFRLHRLAGQQVAPLLLGTAAVSSSDRQVPGHRQGSRQDRQQ